MSDPETKIAVLETRIDGQGKQIDELRANQKWVVLALIGSLIKMFFDFMSKGVGQ